MDDIRNRSDVAARQRLISGGEPRAPTLAPVLTTVVVLPEPPLLVQALAGRAADETADLRAACIAAATRLADAAPEWVAVGADAGGRRTVGPEARGSFVGFGVDLVVGLDTAGSSAPVDPRLALPLLVAGWAAAATGARVRIRGELLATQASPADCAALGGALAAELAGDPAPTGLLVLGDGAATHTERAPGHFDARAAEFDTRVAAALRDADPAVLADLDPGLATEGWPWR